MCHQPDAKAGTKLRSRKKRTDREKETYTSSAFSGIQDHLKKPFVDSRPNAWGEVPIFTEMLDEGDIDEQNIEKSIESVHEEDCQNLEKGLIFNAGFDLQII